MDRARHRGLFFVNDVQHHCVAAREADLAATVGDLSRRARHRANALRHRLLAEQSDNERSLILR